MISKSSPYVAGYRATAYHVPVNYTVFQQKHPYFFITPSNDSKFTLLQLWLKMRKTEKQGAFTFTSTLINSYVIYGKQFRLKTFTVEIKN